MNAKEEQAKSVYKELITVEVASEKVAGTSDQEEFLDNIQARLETKEELKKAEYDHSNKDRLIITTKEGYVFAIQSEKVRYLGIEGDLIGSDTPELVEGDIIFQYTPKNWVRADLELYISAPDYPIYDIEYSFDGSTWTKFDKSVKISNNTMVHARLRYGDKISSYATANIANIDKDLPNITSQISSSDITTRSFKLSLGANDNLSGISQIKWFYKEENAINWKMETDVYHNMNTLDKGETGNQTKTHEFKNLKTGIYKAYADIYDVAGNIASTTEQTITLGVIAGLGNATYSPEYWTNTDVTVTLPTASGVTTRYTIDGSVPTVSSMAYSEPFKVSANCTIYYIYTDGTNITACKSKNVTNIDKKAPVVTSTIEPSSITTNSFKMSIGVQDTDTRSVNASGLSQIKWFYKLIDSTNWTPLTTHSYAGMNSKTPGSRAVTTATREVTGLIANSYQAYAEIYDVAGNMTKSSTLDVTLGAITSIGSASYIPSTWTNGQVTVTLPTTSGLTTRYTTDGSVPTATTGIEYKGTFKVSSNCQINYIYTDGINVNAYGTRNVTNIDTILPRITTALSASNVGANAFTLNLGVQDGGTAESGLSKVRWLYKLNTAGSYTELSTTSYTTMNGTSIGTKNIEAPTRTVINLAKGTYNAYAIVYDVAGNSIQSSTISVTLESVTAVGSASYTPTTWTNGAVTVSLPTEGGFTTRYTTDGSIPTATTGNVYNGTFTVNRNCTVNYLYSDGINTNTYGSKNITNIDTKIPDITTALASTNITTKGFTLTIGVQDTDTNKANASGLASIQWYYRKGTSGNYTALTKTSYATLHGETAGTLDITTATRSVSNLASGSYQAYAIVQDVAGNTRTSSTITINLSNITTIGNATYTPTTWTNGKVKVTLPIAAGYTTRYSTDGSIPTATTGLVYSDAFEVSSNCTINFVYSDGTNANSYGSKNVTSIDTKIPDITTALAASSVTSSGFTLGISVQDTDINTANAAGLSKVRWFYKLSTASTYTEATTTSYTNMNGSTAGSRTIQSPTRALSGLSKGTYNAYAIVYDVAGNSRQSDTITVTLSNITAVGNATYTPTTWTTGQVTVTLPTANGYTTRYTTNGSVPTVSNSTVYGGPFKVSANCTINYIYTDGTNTNTYGSKNVGNIDTTSTIITEAMTQASVDKTSITLTTKVTDSLSGLGKIVWYKSTDKSNWTSETDTYATMNTEVTGTTTTVTATHTFTSLEQNTKYLFYAIVYDCAGNTVSNKSASAPLEVTTGKQLVTSVAMSSSTASVVLGETATIRATVDPADAYNKNVNWTFDSGSGNLQLSSNTTTSGANLTITGKAAGQAVLRATAADGSGKSATCAVTIKPKTMVFAYTGGKQETTLQPGTYTFECWGAQGGGPSTSVHGGYGGYVSGTITLTSSTKFYIYVGGEGAENSAGYNGGGTPGTAVSGAYGAYGGGGASDIRVKDDSLYHRCMVAARWRWM